MAADQKYQQGYPLAPSSVVPRSDEESADNYYESIEKKRKKRVRCLFYIAFLAIFHTVIILVFVLAFLRAKSPKVRLENIRVTNISDTNLRFSARLLVKNTNFGRYRFDSSLGTIVSEGTTVGEFVIPDGRVRARSTKKMYTVTDIVLSSGRRNDTVLALACEATVNGKVELVRVFKKEKSGEMRCNMVINLSSSAVQELDCM